MTSFATGPASARRRHHTHSAYNPPYASIVVDANSGAVLQATQPDSRRHPASLTKIMTLYLLFEQLDAGKLSLNTTLPVSEHASEQQPTKLGLRPGQTITVETAIKAIVTRSANDAAVVIAEAIGGSEAAFARMMTQKARELGMRHTVYVNASGLPNDAQVTTARDEARLGRAIQERFPRYYRYFATEEFDYHGHTIRNHNHLLGSVDGVDGIKTGYIRDSGFNLVISMWRGPRHLVAVVLGGRTARARDAKMRDLLADHIKEASTRRTDSVLADLRSDRRRTAATEPVPLPIAKPLTLHNVAAIDATASIPSASEATAFRAVPRPRPGSTAPIQPLLVKTVTIKPSPQAAAGIMAAVPAPAAGPQADDLPTSSSETEQDETPQTARAETNKPVHSGWMIQIGAFGDEAEARAHLNKAQVRVKRLLGEADPFTETVTKGDHTFYRARFAGLDRHQAEAACRALKRRDIACLTLKN